MRKYDIIIYKKYETLITTCNIITLLIEKIKAKIKHYDIYVLERR